MSDDTIKIAGIDTGKDYLDIAVAGCAEKPLRLSNDAAGFRALGRHLLDGDVRRVGIEASGGYERKVVAHLRGLGLEVALLQPAQVRAYARMHLRRAKNDRLDAQLIAAFTATLETVRAPADPRLAPLSDHLTFIEQTEADIARARTRLEHQHEPRLRAMIEDDIDRLVSRRTGELRALEAFLRAQPDLARKLDLVLSVPGIGTRTALTLIVAMPELGDLSREQAASLAGLAPFDNDSGKRSGRRTIKAGRARIRTALYCAAMPAAYRWNDALIAMRKRLAARAKTHKQIMIACARKLLTFANCVIQRQQPWQKQSPT